MRMNGNLVFNSDASGEIQNVFIERLATAPTFNSAQKGRIYFNTATALYYFNDGAAWAPFATGGNAANLQGEVDAIEAAVGPLLNANGTYAASALSGSLSGTTSLTDALAKLQALADTTAAGLASEITDRGAAVSAEATTRAAADTALGGRIDDEVTRATAAESALGDRITTETNRASSAEGILTTDLANEVTRATGAETTISGNLDLEIQRATAAEAANAAAITAETTRAQGAESTLTTNLAAEVSRATAADAQHTSDIADEVAARQLADQGHDAAIAAEVARATARENAIEADFNARVQGLSWKNPVRVASTGNLAGTVTVVDGITLVDGDRVLLKNQTAAKENGIYVFSSATSTLSRADDMNTAAEFMAATFYVREGSTQADLGFTQTAEVTTVDTDAVTFVQFNGAGSVSAGDGMTQAGNIINVGAADSSITVGPDSIKVSDALQTAISQNTANIATETTRATTKEDLLDAAIQQEASDRADAVSAEHDAMVDAVAAEATRATTAEGTLQTNLNTESSRAVAAEGVIAGNLASEISRATSAELVIAGDLASEITRATTAEGVLSDDIDAVAADLATEVARVSKMYYLYSAGSATTSHTVSHNLGQKYCNVTIVDDTDNVVIPQSIVFDGVNQLTVTFTSALQCKVIVMGLVVAG